ncbi:MAG: hypothetical protein QXI61_06710, partial [Nitrososphaerota archaeon]
MNDANKERIWIKYEKMVSWIAWKFTRQYGGDFSEWFSEAALIFFEALDTYQKDKSKMSTWTAFKIITGLKEKVRKEARRYSLIGKVLNLDDSECKCEVEEKQQNISFIDQLKMIISEEAQIVLDLLLNSQEKDYKNK